MKKNVYAGLFLVSFATLLFEILLTRIFSVIMWYHFAFVAISIAMFGMTMGAIVVYLLPDYFTREKISRHLAVNSFLFSLSIIFSFMIQLHIPVAIDSSVRGVFFLMFDFILISIAFVFSGICVCLVLTRFPNYINSLYAVDLAGAAAGCILLVFILRVIDPPTAVIGAAFLAGLGAFCFAADKYCGGLRKVIAVSCFLLLSFLMINGILVYKQCPLLRVIWVNGKQEGRPIYEKWNEFSRIIVRGNPNIPSKPFGWGISPLYYSQQRIKQLIMWIDNGEYTVITNFDRNLNSLDYLKYDVTNLVHYLRPNAKVLIIGTGGGRDILSALVFHQKSIVGVEMNGDINNTVNKRFGDFSGHLDKIPNVIFVNDEARSYIARTKEKFDIIQSSFIGTWAANTAGAFVLTENSLYTVEAWKIYLDHLTPNGVLSFDHAYIKEIPATLYKLTALASNALMKSGIKNPRDHILIADSLFKRLKDSSLSTATMLISKEPFSDGDLNLFEKTARDMKFNIILSPHFSVDPNLTAIASGKNFDSFISAFPINISAPTDDRPFFFHSQRLKNIFDLKLQRQYHLNNSKNAVYVLGVLLIIVTVLMFCCMIMPLMLTADKTVLKGALPFFIFFMAIGFGFMFIEISQMQRLNIFLGHPIYGLSVVLFGLLLSSGLGSYLSQKIGGHVAGKASVVLLLFLLCALLVFGVCTTGLLQEFQSFETLPRVLIALGIVFPLGLFMGIPFPLGMKLASTRTSPLTAWLWGINGAASICASVFATAISLESGITATYWVGFLFYIIAFLAFVWLNYDP